MNNPHISLELAEEFFDEYTVTPLRIPNNSFAFSCGPKRYLLNDNSLVPAGRKLLIDLPRSLDDF